MRIPPRNLVFLVLILLCMLVILGGYLLHIQENGPNDLVAIVHGAKILYKDVKVDPKTVQLSHAEQISASQLKSEVHKQEMRRLAGKIHKVIFEQKIDELRITVSEKEVDSRVDEIFRQTNMTSEKAAAVCENARALHEALAAWQKDPSHGDVIYNEKLAGSLISKEQWKAFQVAYDTPEKLKSLVVPKNIDDMKKNSRESSRMDVLNKKLEDVITKNVSVKAEEIEAAYQKKYGNLPERPPLEEVMEKLNVQLLSKKKQEAKKVWWQEHYRQAKIEIKDQRFKDVLNILPYPRKLPPPKAAPATQNSLVISPK